MLGHLSARASCVVCRPGREGTGAAVRRLGLSVRSGMVRNFSFLRITARGSGVINCVETREKGFREGFRATCVIVNVLGGCEKGNVKAAFFGGLSL